MVERARSGAPSPSKSCPEGLPTEKLSEESPAARSHSWSSVGLRCATAAGFVASPSMPSASPTEAPPSATVRDEPSSTPEPTYVSSASAGAEEREQERRRPRMLALPK